MRLLSHCATSALIVSMREADLTSPPHGPAHHVYCNGGSTFLYASLTTLQSSSLPMLNRELTRIMVALGARIHGPIVSEPGFYGDLCKIFFWLTTKKETLFKLPRRLYQNPQQIWDVPVFVFHKQSCKNLRATYKIQNRILVLRYNSMVYWHELLIMNPRRYDLFQLTRDWELCRESLGWRRYKLPVRGPMPKPDE